jgi:PKD repeat protein
MTGKKIFQSVIVLMLLLGAPVAAFAQAGLSIDVTTSVSCDSANFAFDLPGDFASYKVMLEFGDEDDFDEIGQPAGSFNVTHPYPSQGEYEWTLTVTDDDGLVIVAEADGIVTIDGPTVTLDSIPFPPLLTIESGEASIDFITEVSGGTESNIYTWDLNEDGLPDAGLSGGTASYTYNAGGNYEASVTVTDSDSCDLSSTATLTVVVVDPEADPQDACHPTAQKIAEAVSIIFLDARAEQTYTCEDIFNIFEGSLTGNHTGFGRLWHAYQLTQTIPDLTWEEIRDWKLDGSSWGAITQLNRFADTLKDYGIRDLFDLVVNGDNTVGEIRTAARTAVRYEADFSDALTRLSEGAKAGELGQFYKLASDLDLGVEDLTILDDYLAEGMTLPELRHAANFAERFGVLWIDIVDVKSFDHSWGEIGQAYRLADGDATAADILTMGVQDYRSSQREDARTEREGERTAREEERAERTGERLAEQFGIDDVNEVMGFYNDCDGSWGCARKKLREEYQSRASSDRDLRTASQIASKYGISDAEVTEYFESNCFGDWNCVRTHYRDLNKNVPKNNKDK